MYIPVWVFVFFGLYWLLGPYLFIWPAKLVWFAARSAWRLMWSWPVMVLAFAWGAAGSVYGRKADQDTWATLAIVTGIALWVRIAVILRAKDIERARTKNRAVTKPVVAAPQETLEARLGEDEPQAVGSSGWTPPTR